MKFFAILNDSFREAIDSKVLYVMVGLSLLVILIVGSISFQPMPAKAAFPVIVQSIAFESQFQDRAQQRLAFSHGAVSEVRQLDESSQPHLGEYRFELRGTWAPHRDPFNEGPFKKVDPENAPKIPPITQDEAEENLKRLFALHDVDVLAIEPIEPLPGQIKPNVFKFDVRVRGGGVGRSWLHETWLLFGAWKWPIPATLARSVHYIEDTIVNGWGAWLAILVSIVITAFFIPNMLHKGTIDLLLAKPIGRVPLLIYKYVGGLTFVFLVSAVAVGGIYVVIGLRSGIWAPGFLLSVLVLTFFFAVIYSISTLVAVLTRSAVISILLSALAWLIFAVIGRVYLAVEMLGNDPNKTIVVPDWFASTMRFLHAVTPRTTDLDFVVTKILNASLLSDGELRRLMLDRLPEIHWGETVGVSAAFIAAMLGLACWRFATRDY